jgi:uncharacterized membrane protein YqjE
MVNSATMNGSSNGQRVDESAAQVGENVANLASELVTLAELQAKLAVLDVQESAERAATPAAALIGGACLSLGAVPVLLLSITWALDRWTPLALEAAAAIVALIALTIGATCIAAAYARIKDSCRTMNRSREELQANLRWIKQAIQQSSAIRGRRPF